MHAPQLAKYARPAAQKGYASYAQGLAPPFCAFLPSLHHSFTKPLTHPSNPCDPNTSPSTTYTIILHRFDRRLYAYLIEYQNFKKHIKKPKSDEICSAGTKRAEQPLGWAAQPALRRLLAYSQAPMPAMQINSAKPWSTRKSILCILWHISVHQG